MAHITSELVLDGWAHRLGLELAADPPETSSSPLDELLRTHSQVVQLLRQHPYSLPIYILQARTLQSLGYPDLAAGAAYKALLLSDAIQDEGDEYSEQAIEAFQAVLAIAPLPDSCRVTPDQSEKDLRGRTTTALQTFYLPIIYDILSTSLLHCGCFRTANTYCIQAKKTFPKDPRFDHLLRTIYLDVSLMLSKSASSFDLDTPSTWPDQGYVRRELYPWNVLEPDRLSELDQLRGMMDEVAPKLEILAVDLPVLSGSTSNLPAEKMVKQLGVFAKEDISPGEIVLNETSLLTANNKLQDALCDACSADLPAISSPDFDKTVSCADCEVIFCCQNCHDNAADLYHTALCGMDVEAIARDVAPAEAADSLYSLLLLRALAMAETQHCHPLELKEVKYIWGDFHSLPLEEHWNPVDPTCPSFCGLPQTLPFSFEYNIRLPFHMLEKMDVDIFRHPQYDVWVFNTLYAKFRGTASARLSGLGGRAIRGPEVSAVHPMWCMANHSCDPNVSWEWGGSIKFWTRETRVTWRRDGDEAKKSEAGIRKGEEVLNHYCDVDLAVQDRREWARGALGGDCRCVRCAWEARESV